MVDVSRQIDLGGMDLLVRSINTGVTVNSTAPSNTSGVGISGGSTLTLTANTHAGRQINLDSATSTTITLPAATGTGNKYRFVVTAVPSGSHVIKVASATDFMSGLLPMTLVGTPTTNNVWPATATGAIGSRSDTITLNHTTTGAATVGEWVEVQDIASTQWQVNGVLSQTGSAATPFSAAV